MAPARVPAASAHRFGLKRKQLASKAGVSASLIGRAERGADVRLSTLRKIYAALGCRLLCVPAGGLYDMDWESAHLDNAWYDDNLKTERHLARSRHLHELFRRRFIREMNENAISPLAPDLN